MARIVPIPLLALAAAFALAAGSGAAQPSDVPLAAEQIERGQATFRQHCTECHGRSLEGTPQFPALVGDAFEADWAGRTLGEFYTYVHELMPLGAGGSLTDEEYADVVAYVLSQNTVSTSDEAFDPADEEALAVELAFESGEDADDP